MTEEEKINLKKLLMIFWDKFSKTDTFYIKKEKLMKYNIYIIDNNFKKLFKKEVDGETVRRFMASLNEEQRKYIEIEHIRDDNSPEQIMIRRNEEAWEK